MSDRNPSQPYSPRDSQRYAELSDLLGDIGVSSPAVPQRASLEPVYDQVEQPSLESALASVDANFPIKPRELSISNPAMSRSWQAAPGSMARATPVAAPLAPQALDAWNLRPSYNPNAHTAEEAFYPTPEAAPSMTTPEFDPELQEQFQPEFGAAAEPELLDEDAFQSVLDGLEGDILGDEELVEMAEPYTPEFQQPEQPESVVNEVAAIYEPAIPTEQSFAPAYQAPVAEIPAAHVQVADAFDPMADFDAAFDRDLSSRVTSEPEYEEIEPEVASYPTRDAQPGFASPIGTIAATSVAGAGVAAIAGAMRANPSREVQSVSDALPAAVNIGKQKSNFEPPLMDVVSPYDDVPVTGSLKVPDYVAAEPEKVPTPVYDDFEVDDFQPSATQSRTQHAAPLPASTENAVAAVDDFADVNFDDAFDDNFNPTDELADLVGSNVETDPLFSTTKDDDFTPMPAMPPIDAPKSSRGKWMAFGALGLAVFGALAWYGSSSDAVDGGVEPAIVRADNEPVRVAPDNPGGTVVPNQDRVVFNEVGNANAVPEQQQETLVDGRQEPAIAAAPAKEADRVLNGDTAAEPAAGTGTAIAPRAVQTVTVRPDGTLVVNEPAAPVAAAPQAEVTPEARPEAAAGQAEQPMPAPTVADAATPPAETPAAQVPAAETPVAEAPAADAPLKEMAETKVPVREVEIKAVTQKPKAKAQTAPAAEALDAVPSRPSDQPVNIVNPQTPALPDQPAEQQTAAADPAPAPAAGAYSIQIASTPSEEAAASTLRSLSGKFGSVLGGKDYTIQKAEVPGKGTVFRVRISAGSKEEAGKLCARYKSAGGSCFVTR